MWVLQSALYMSLPDYLIILRCLNSLHGLKLKHLSQPGACVPYMIHLSRLTCKVHVSGTADQFHSFNLPGAFVFPLYAQPILPMVLKQPSYFSIGQIMHGSLKSTHLLFLFHQIPGNLSFLHDTSHFLGCYLCK